MPNELIVEPAEDLRIDKVMELREAINNGKYDLDMRVNDLLGKLETNLDGLVQTETETKTPPADETQPDPLDDSQPLDGQDDFDDQALFGEFESLDALGPDDLEKKITIRGEPHTVVETSSPVNGFCPVSIS